MDSSNEDQDRKGKCKCKSIEEEPKNVVNLLPERFPEGVRVIVVLDDAPLLQQVVGMLEKHSYLVTSCNNAVAALTMIQVDGNKFDLILTIANIHGFNLLESISRDQDLPVIMILNDDAKESVIECISKGACDCLISPIQEQDLKLLYKHVIPNMIKRTRNAEVGSSSGSVGKKAKLFWTTDLDKKFVAAIEKLGPTNAVPSKILKQMNVEGITRAQVSSHLQEYRRSHEPGLSTLNPDLQQDRQMELPLRIEQVSSHFQEYRRSHEPGLSTPNPYLQQERQMALPLRIDGSGESSSCSVTKPHQPQFRGQWTNFKPPEARPVIGGSGELNYPSVPRPANSMFPRLPGSSYHNVPPMHLWSQTHPSVSPTGNFASYETRSPAFPYGQHNGVRATPHSPSYIGIERPQMPHQPMSRSVTQTGQWVLPEVGSPPVEEAESESDDGFPKIM